MEQKLDDQLYWPPISFPDKFWLGWVFLFMGLLFPVGAWLIWSGSKERNLCLQRRKQTKISTCSILMSTVEYVGGHPLIPDAGTMVLGLTATQIIIYSRDSQYAIRPKASIPLEDVIQAGMGRPKSAREVYDEDYGHTIDVYEHSPFLSILFKLSDDNFRASFQSFEPDTPQKWYNQITALKYQLKSTSNMQDETTKNRGAGLTSA